METARTNGDARAVERREKKYQSIVASIERAQRKLEKADKTSHRMIRLIGKLERQRKRLRTAIDKAKPVVYAEQIAASLESTGRAERPAKGKTAEPKAKAKPKVEDVTDIPFSELPIADKLPEDDLDIRKNAWLDRTGHVTQAAKDELAGLKADEKAKAEILAAQAEKKKVKAKASSEKSRAKAKGELRKMPLSGKAALAAIHGE